MYTATESKQRNNPPELWRPTRAMNIYREEQREGRTRSDEKEREETKGKENPQAQAKNARTPQPATSPGGGRAGDGQRSPSKG